MAQISIDEIYPGEKRDAMKQYTITCSEDELVEVMKVLHTLRMERYPLIHPKVFVTEIIKDLQDNLAKY